MNGRAPRASARALPAALAASALCALVACRTRSAAPSPPAAPAPATLEPATSDLLLRIARAEDRRRPQDLPAGASDAADVTVRRAAARALARVLDPDDHGLLRALVDEDREVATWGAYGLGESCRGREEAHARAIAARLLSLPAGDVEAPPGLGAGAGAVMLRALGRCGGGLAERTLVAWLTAGGADGEAAAFALADVASRQGSLSDETAQALLDVVHATPHLDAGFAPFVRPDTALPHGIEGRLAIEAHGALDRAGPSRLFAVRALGRSEGPLVTGDLARVAGSPDFAVAERVEAARALGRRRSAQPALGAAVAAMVPDRAESLEGGRLGVLLEAVAGLSSDVAPETTDALWRMARFEPAEGAGPGVVRRASALRCAVALQLARTAWDADVLRHCDLGDGEIGERARLSALDRAPLTGGRRQAWATLARSAHPRVRDAAIEAIGRHPELRDAAIAALAEALASDRPGVVATAAAVVHSHPDRVFVLAESERRAALDPASSPPSAHPARIVDPGVARALRAAFARGWTRDLVETRLALLDAASVAALPEGRAFAEAACADANATLRARAARTLAALGADVARCDPPAAEATAPEIAHALDRPVRIVFETDAGPLTLRIDPAFAPVAATRLVDLARAGFYASTPFVRVVPGFVVQFGDPGGDGFGGSGDSLRCETSPVPFAAGDVGVALAGRDTGSSQLFVTLGRYPHLDGEYAWVGRAEGDWSGVTEGDWIRAVQVEP
jgi:cyclophilin family peptidyl-prolyl cis-trans isomerase